MNLLLQRCGPVPGNSGEDNGVLRRTAVTSRRGPRDSRQSAPDTQGSVRSRVAHDFSRVRVHAGQPTVQRDDVAVDPATQRAGCRSKVGTCDFYRCRHELAGGRHSASNYYLGYGLKYCERFSRATRPKLSPSGRMWLDHTLLCLQEFIDRNVPVDADPERVKSMAFDSHPGCYVTSGLCFLSPGDWSVIFKTIDPWDNDLVQVLVTAVYCGGNYLPMLFPMHSLAAGGGYRGLMERDRQQAFRRYPFRQPAASTSRPAEGGD